MVYFGWPRAHEDAAVRAVHASLAMLAAMGSLNAHLEARHGVRLQVRLGLHTGMAVIGEMGTGGRHEQLAMGDTPNIAARVQGVAAPDTVAISAATARLMHQAFDLLTKIMTSLTGDLQYEFLGMGILPAVVSRVWLSWTLAEIGEFSEAIRHGAESLRIAESMDHPYSLAHACFGIGLVYIRQGEFSQAISPLERGHAISQSYSPVASPVNAAHLGYALALSGQALEAIPLLEHALEQANATRLLFYHSLWVAWLSEAHFLAGSLEPANELARQALDFSRNRQERGHKAWALRLQGEPPRRARIFTACEHYAVANSVNRRTSGG
jgi:tetratricopeptide (TPR) repeat protein